MIKSFWVDDVRMQGESIMGYRGGYVKRGQLKRIERPYWQVKGHDGRENAKNF